MIDDLLDIAEILEGLTEDCSLKVKTELKNAILVLNTIIEKSEKEQEEINTEELIKVQDQLEYISNMKNVDSFVRNEIFNVLSIMETLV